MMTPDDLAALAAFAKSCDLLVAGKQCLGWMVRSGRLQPDGRDGYTLKVLLPRGVAHVVTVEADGVTMQGAVNALHAQAIEKGMGALGAPF